MSTQQRILEIIKSVTPDGDMGINIDENTNLFTDLGIDSVLLIQLITEIEDQFEIEFDAEFEYEKYGRIGELIDYIEGMTEA